MLASFVQGSLRLGLVVRGLLHLGLVTLPPLAMTVASPLRPPASSLGLGDFAELVRGNLNLAGRYLRYPKILLNKKLVFSGGPLGDSNESLAIKTVFIGFVPMNFALKESRIDDVDTNIIMALVRHNVFLKSPRRSPHLHYLYRYLSQE